MWLRKIIVLLVVLLLTACDVSQLPSPFHARDMAAKFSQVDFRLTDQHGIPHTLADFRGKVVVMFFGYTQCPDVCPTILADLKNMMDLLGKDADKVQVLFVTLDPERDKPDMLAAYVGAFNPTFLALSGDASATAQTAKTFNITYKKHPTASGYGMDHSDGSYVIDQKGQVRLLASYPVHSNALAEDIRLLLTGV